MGLSYSELVIFSSKRDALQICYHKYYRGDIHSPNSSRSTGKSSRDLGAVGGSTPAHIGKHRRPVLVCSKAVFST